MQCVRLVQPQPDNELPCTLAGQGSSLGRVIGGNDHDSGVIEGSTERPGE